MRIPPVGHNPARAHLVEALEADLIGPFGRATGSITSAAPEVLRIAPSRWYLTGFLVPREQGEIEDDPDDKDDDPGAGDDEDDDDAGKPDPSVKRPRRLPASMGLAVFVPPAATHVVVHLSWADYKRIDVAGRRQWSRSFQQRTLELALDGAKLRAGVEVRGAGGLRVEGRLEAAFDGSRSLAVFLVNAREPEPSTAARDESYVFQVHLALECADGFVGREDRSDEKSDEFDDKVNDLQFRDRREWATGLGVSARVDTSKVPVTRVETAWLPRSEVAPVVQRELPDVLVDIEALSGLTSAADAQAKLLPLVAAYRRWIDRQTAVPLDSPERRETRDGLIHRARHAADRVEAGIALLVKDPAVFQAFRWMNAVMAQAERKARPAVRPAWRLFQLAFILLNLPSTDDEAHPDRQLVELIFFPTGGGKTQAYLGLIAVTLLLRRLRGQTRDDKGLGVAVLLRYTLRLLTLDQLGRAATLVCGLELLRQKHVTQLGDVRFSIGLWVGRSATANTLVEVAKQVTEYKADSNPKAQSPFPLASCPWCAAPFVRECFTLIGKKAHPEDIIVGCSNLECPFCAGKTREGLPVLFVDEQVYRELPAFVVATVDKFALLPWRGETGMLFGRALGRTGRAFVGPCDDEKALKSAAVKLKNGLRPPDLIVQDELHLISGPLGSMVGLYECAVLTLAPKAKIVASTATVRRAREQVSRLYGRQVALFPPPGPDASETFFARVSKLGARQYLGVAASGRPMKGILLRVYASLLAAAERARETDSEAADPYLTLVGYFNSLRELGGMRRLVEDEVRRRAADHDRRRPEDFDAEAPHPWYRSRRVGEPVEMTSREKTLAIKETKRRLDLAAADPQSVDVLLASNMISVGVDIDRLGLMVMAGQPKTTSEYIQASSRVGRKADKPGLVVTCFNVVRPRDRSHFERFAQYHDSFYRFVEATSVTPFSAPALDRGLAGVVVALGRLMQTSMSAPLAVSQLAKGRAALEATLAGVAARAAYGLGREEGERASAQVMARAMSLLDSWNNIIEQAKKDAATRAYSPYDPAGKGHKALLRSVLDPLDNISPDEQRFDAPLSMRDVEASVHLWVTRQPLGGYQEPKKQAPVATAEADDAPEA